MASRKDVVGKFAMANRKDVVRKFAMASRKDVIRKFAKANRKDVVGQFVVWGHSDSLTCSEVTCFMVQIWATVKRLDGLVKVKQKRHVCHAALSWIRLAMSPCVVRHVHRV